MSVLLTGKTNIANYIILYFAESKIVVIHDTLYSVPRLVVPWGIKHGWGRHTFPFISII